VGQPRSRTRRQGQDSRAVQDTEQIRPSRIRTFDCIGPLRDALLDVMVEARASHDEAAPDLPNLSYFLI
jgi:hypothetical protein